MSSGVKTVTGPISTEHAAEVGREAGRGNPPSDETLNSIRNAGIEAVHAYQKGVDSTGGVRPWEADAAAAAENRSHQSSDSSSETK